MTVDPDTAEPITKASPTASETSPSDAPSPKPPNEHAEAAAPASSPESSGPDAPEASPVTAQSESQPAGDPSTPNDESTTTPPVDVASATSSHAMESQVDDSPAAASAAAPEQQHAPAVGSDVSADASQADATAVASPSDSPVGSASTGAESSSGAADGESGPASPAADAQRPSERIQIGSRRDGDEAEALRPNPVMPVASTSEPQEAPRKAYPPPNVRDRLPPELEQELEAALGGESLDDIMSASNSGQAPAELAPETKVSGTVVSLHEEDVFIDLGGRNQGVMPVKQFETPPETGAAIDVVVVRHDAEQGLYEVSLPSAAVDVGNWDEVQEGQVIEVSITGSNKGGLECQIAGLRGFIPMGQISIFRVENAEEYVGQRLACVVTEANRRRKNLVLSHRALMERERKEKREQLLAELAPGQIREGVVRSLQDFGAFIDLGGADGLIHVSQLSWDRVGHPSEVLQVGQSVSVRVEKVNAETGKISLAYRDLGANPWDDAASKYVAGQRVKGHVTKLMQFGAFVKLEPGVEGLIHISELGHGRVFRTGDVVSEGQEVEVQVLTVDVGAQRIGLSLKALMAKPEKPQSKKDQEQQEGPVPVPKDAPRPDPRVRDKELKGGLGGPSGGEKFGLRW